MCVHVLQEIKLSSLRAKPHEEVAGDEQEMAAAVMAAAKKTLITQVCTLNLWIKHNDRDSILL